MGAILTLLAMAAFQDAPPPAQDAPPPPQDAPKTDKRDTPTDPAETIDGRRRPDYRNQLPEAVIQNNPGAVRAPPPEAFPTDQVPIPDRWRLVQSLGIVSENWRDPYNQNTLKGDRPVNRAKVPWLPIHHDDWFFSLNLVSDTVLEPRTFPIPVGVQTTERPQSLDVFGSQGSFVFSQTFIAGASLTKGSGAFKPPEIEYRVAFAYNISHVNVPERRVLDVRPSRPSRRTDSFFGVQEFFVDYHIRNVSDRYDFDSIRVGIQPFQNDFRGFLFNDQQLGIRLFGNRDGNRFQYNLAAFWRLEKDTNSGLNSVIRSPRDDFVFIANAYRQDFLIPGLTSQLTAVYNRNREGNDVEIDDNGFPVRPALIGDLRGRDYDIVYLGYNADGRIGRINVTASAYAALGEDRNSIFTSRPAQVRAYFGATELSYDRDWMRFRVSALYASGDRDPYDNTETGFDAIFENPVFAGADTSYWIRQSIPFAGGGRVISLSGRNGVLNSVRSSKEQGQSNFNNPGTFLIGAGADFDLTPGLRLSANANRLAFDDTITLQVLRNEGSIPSEIGWDLSAAAIYRPFATQNVVFRVSGAVLMPSDGFRDLFTNRSQDRQYYSVLGNIILSY
ncbi:hypothetical protein P1X14_14260 [Sphingomonas sp. AOB5]|uniref:hypothetical protein n=1 Tax=Sphingomonas sp. AOB5 TaxID=3034017 RepID=UPI0023FA0316|nr:hypothetical protein [Sphingomonas sp. AOB5]MDF7776414.1 hypothetical protein [Sphingomonas sp. AOB5]